jgi:hypothetical protein
MLLTTTASSRPNVHPTACRNCRRRGRKCDRTLPTCQSCKDRSCVCEGYVTRWAGVAARGRLRGKTIPVLLDEDTGGKRGVEKGSPSSTASSTALAGSSQPETGTSRNRRRQSQDASESPPDSAALVVERIVPAPVDGLDSFIDYCESCLAVLSSQGWQTLCYTLSVTMQTLHSSGRRRIMSCPGSLPPSKIYSQLTTACISSCL